LKRDLNARRAFAAMAGSGTQELFPKIGLEDEGLPGTFTLVAIYLMGEFSNLARTHIRHVQ
jgi:hypothetical protein